MEAMLEGENPNRGNDSLQTTLAINAPDSDPSTDSLASVDGKLFNSL